MPTICGEIADDILLDCDNKPVGGVQPLMWVIPIDIWNGATITYDETNPLIIRTVTLPVGKKAFQFEVYKRGHKPKFEAQDTDYGVNYKHSIATNIPVYNDDVKAQIQGITNGYNVFIVENVQKTGVPFEVYGGTNGLRMPDLVRDLAANEGVITGTFTNDADMNEPLPPYTFKAAAGTYAATKALIVALTTPAEA